MVRARTLVLSLLAVASLAFLATGCDNGDREVSGVQPDTAQQPMMEQDTLDKVLPLDQAQTAYDKAKKAFAAASNDAKAKQAMVSAACDLANAHMNGDEDRKVKYKEALQDYREALKLDPTNEEAQKNSSLIISIYKQMGRPVPGGDG